MTGHVRGLVVSWPSALTLALMLSATADAFGAPSKDACISAAEQSQPLRRDHHLKAARERLLVCSQPECPSFVRDDCIPWLAELDRALPSVVIHAVDGAGADVANVRVVIDGERAKEGDGAEIVVDPGNHVFKFEHAGSPTLEQSIVIREGERHRVVSVTIADAPAPGAKAPASAAKPAASTASTSNRILPIALMVAGGASLLVGSFFWVSGLSDRSSLADSCAPSHTCTSSTVDSAHGKLVLGDVLGGVGLALGGVGAFLYLSRPPPSPAQPATSAFAGALLEARGSF